MIGSGTGLHWPQLDEDISVEDLLAGRPSVETQQSLQKWLAARGNPGVADRMNGDDTHIPGVTDDPVIQLILSGQASTLDEAEEMYLDASLPLVYELLRSPATDEELMQHPLFRLLVVRGSRGWEDSLF